MQIVEIYTKTRFNVERSILKERLGEGYVVKTCAAEAPNFCFEITRAQDFVLGFEVAGARSAEFLSIIAEDYVFQHPGIQPEMLSDYLRSRARHPLRRRRSPAHVAEAC